MQADKKFLLLSLIIIISIVFLSGCQLSNLNFSNSIGFSDIIEIVKEISIHISDVNTLILTYIDELLGKQNTASALTLPVLVEGTQVTFQVQVPAGTSENDAVYLSILDEVTGLALNA